MRFQYSLKALRPAATHRRYVTCAAVLLIAAYCTYVVNLDFDLGLRPEHTALPVAVVVEGPAEDELATIEIREGQRTRPKRWFQRSSGACRWEQPTAGLMDQVVLFVPDETLAKVRTVRVCVGEAEFAFAGSELRETWKWQEAKVGLGGWIRRPGTLFRSHRGLSATRSRLWWQTRRMNWPGDGLFVGRFLGLFVPMVVYLVAGWIAAAWLLAKPGRKQWLRRGLGLDGQEGQDAPEAVGHARASFGWALAALGVFATGMTLLELQEPYYFTEDDTFSQFFPTILDGCRSLDAGIFPVWNPQQFLGSPTSSLGYYALTYPGTYGSYLVARHVLGNEMLSMEVFSILHLGAGLLAMFWAAQCAGISPPLAAAAGLSYVLSGFALVAGRSWYYMAPVHLWTPLLIVGVIGLQSGRVGIRWVLAMGLVIGAFFHAGNVQMWAYSVGFFLLAITLLVVLCAVPLPRALWVLPALALGLGLSAPLLLVQGQEASHIQRAASGNGIDRALVAVLLPYPLADAPHPNGHGGSMGPLYYSGTVFAAACLAWGTVALGLVMTWRNRNWFAWMRRGLVRNVWLACAAVAVIMALGDTGLVWTITSKLPGLNKFTNPFKFLAYTNLFFALAGALVLERTLAARCAARTFGEV